MQMLTRPCSVVLLRAVALVWTAIGGLATIFGVAIFFSTLITGGTWAAIGQAAGGLLATCSVLWSGAVLWLLRKSYFGSKQLNRLLLIRPERDSVNSWTSIF